MALQPRSGLREGTLRKQTQFVSASSWQHFNNLFPWGTAAYTSHEYRQATKSCRIQIVFTSTIGPL